MLIVYDYYIINYRAINGLFQKRLNPPPVEDINKKFPRCRVKVVGMSKFEGKARISRVVNAKKVENSKGVIIKVTGNPGG